MGGQSLTYCLHVRKASTMGIPGTSLSNGCTVDAVPRRAICPATRTKVDSACPSTRMYALASNKLSARAASRVCTFVLVTMFCWLKRITDMFPALWLKDARRRCKSSSSCVSSFDSKKITHGCVAFVSAATLAVSPLRHCGKKLRRA